MQKSTRKKVAIIVLVIFALTIVAYPVLFSPHDTPAGVEPVEISPNN